MKAANPATVPNTAPLRRRLPNYQLQTTNYKLPITPRHARDSICLAANSGNVRRMALVSVNPATGKRIAVYRNHTTAEIEQSLARAAAAQRDWREVPVRQRAALLRKLGRELKSRRDALAALATDEMGKPIAQARAEVEKCAALCDFYATHGPALLAEQPGDGPTAHARVVFEPLGTVLAIMPWNFPFWQVMRAAVPTLLGGNAMLLKHAPNVPGCAVALDRIMQRVGFPTGVFQTLLIDTRPVPKLIADPRIHGVTLTGSTRAGREVGALAGAAVKPAVFELGGSDPVLVLEDADLDLAAETAASARLINSGQSCVCAKRFLVARPILRDFEQRFTARIAHRRLGNPTEPATDIGPLARADLRDHLVRQSNRTIRQGARVLLEGGPQRGPGFFFAPTVLSDIKPGMAAFDEETFGPLAAIVPVRDEAHAVTLANATRFGLGASVFTRSKTRARRIAAQLEAGSVFVNDFVRSSPELPFGGIKDSGVGRELGRWGLHSFMNVKTVVGV
jgi:succinate-semialdehyde dehydrogenase/glutarate-semialdehyde dehydrogenase